MNDSGARLHELISSIPWTRLMTARGRAADFPEMVQKSADGTADQATFEAISQNIEHQDTLYQASPSMTDVLIELLDQPRADRAAVLSILRTVYAAALDKYLSHGHLDSPIIPLEDDLLPPFVSKDDDEMVFEELDDSNWPYWHQLCLESIEAARERIESLSVVDGPVGAAAREFFVTFPLWSGYDRREVDGALDRLRAARLGR